MDILDYFVQVDYSYIGLYCCALYWIILLWIILSYIAVDYYREHIKWNEG